MFQIFRCLAEIYNYFSGTHCNLNLISDAYTFLYNYTWLNTPIVYIQYYINKCKNACLCYIVCVYIIYRKRYFVSEYTPIDGNIAYSVNSHQNTGKFYNIKEPIYLCFLLEITSTNVNLLILHALLWDIIL